MKTIRHVLHPTDFSESSRNAFQLACSMARDYGASLIVLHVIPPPVLVGGSDPVACQIIEDFYRQQREKLSQLRPPDATVEVDHRLTRGEPVDEILRAAKESNCDMIVMGTHGATGLKRVLMGSVAEGVTRASGCPVVIVKTPSQEA
jgi:nucleotide-binding universal stress UspA family protein